MRLRKSKLALAALATTLLVAATSALGILILTKNLAAALLLGLGFGSAVLALSFGVARINDRVGDLLGNLRRVETTVVRSVQAGSAEVRRELPKLHAAQTTISTAPPERPAPQALLEALIDVPHSPVGSGVRRPLPIPRETISEDDRAHWNESRFTATRLQLTERAMPWRPVRHPAARSIPVAMIADEFTLKSFTPEFDVHRLVPATWRDVMARAKPALFFCESAWSGGTPPDRPWAGQIYGSARWAQDRRSTLFEILTYCRKNGIPTVFWNKEDPVHFSDRINDFVTTARLFDFVFTTAAECVPLYRRDAGVKHVAALPFAVQPSIFNPLGARERQDAAVFAGTWYPRYPKRSAAAAQIMDLVLSTGRDLVIYDRNFAHPKNYEYPERYQPYRRPSIAFEETAAAYRANKFGITLNTITDSKTMFARRVFEMAACGNVVLSNTALGVEHFFGDSVIYADREPERFLELTDDDYVRIQKSAFEVALDNTYTHRARSILEAVGIPSDDPFQKPTVAVRIASQADFASARRMQQEGGIQQLLCLVTADSEPLLLSSIQRLALPDVLVESEKRVLQGQYRSRSLLRTPHVFFAESVQESIPSGDWFASAQRHLQYAEKPIAPGSAAPGIHLKHRAVDSVQGSLMSADQFDRHICCGEPIDTVYEL